MKLNLVYGNNPRSDTTLSGFTQVDFYEKDLNYLDEVCEDAECDTIIADDLIDYFPSTLVDILLESLLVKLRHGGRIVIGGTDLNEVVRNLFNKNLSTVNANILLFGMQNEPWEFRKSVLPAAELATALKQCGLKILKNRTNPENCHYVIEAERP